MTDREQRLADALRRGPRQSPPPGLADAIKNDIPETISSHRRFPVRQGWLIAATLITMVGAGWLALQLIRTDPSAPSVVLSERLDEAPKETFAGTEEGQSLDDRVMAEPEAAAEAVEETIDRTENRTGERTPDPTNTLGVSESASSSPPAEAAKLENPESSGTGITVTASAPPVFAQESVAARDRADLPSPPPPPAAAPAPQAGRTEPGREIKAMGSREQPALDDSHDPEDETISYDGLRETIAAGQLPDRANIDVDTLVNHFDYGDRAPRSRGQVSLFIEGGAAPFQPGRWRTVRIGIRSGSAAGPIGEGAELEVTFDPTAVSLYRRVGGSSVHQAIEDTTTIIEVGRIPGDHARTWLYEVKLRTEISLDQSVVSARLRYGADDRLEIDRSLELGHIAPTWSSSSTSLRSAILIGALAENFGPESRRIDDLELLQLARELREASDADDAVVDLTRLIEQTVRLQGRGERHH